jgi:hypothetical protein
MEEGAKRCEPKNRIVATLQTLFLTQDPFQATIEDEVMNTEQLNDIVAKTGGFSGREISKLMIAVQGAIFASSDGILTPIMIEKIVSIKVKEHNMKVEMMTKPIAEEAANLVVLTPTRACKTESLANDLVFEETDLSFESKSEDVETNANASNNLSDLSCSSSEKEVDAPDNSRACRNQVAKEESIISNEVVVPTKSSAKLDNKIVEEETQLSEQGLLSINCSSRKKLEAATDPVSSASLIVNTAPGIPGESLTANSVTAASFLAQYVGTIQCLHLWTNFISRQFSNKDTSCGRKTLYCAKASYVLQHCWCDSGMPFSLHSWV